MRAARLFFVVFIILYSLFFAHTPTSFAQTKEPAYNTSSDVPKNLHNGIQNLFIEISSALTCQLAGIDTIDSQAKCLGVDKQTGKIGFVKNGGGAINAVNSMISQLYTPPAHTFEYVAYLQQNFGFSKSAYAQSGAGFYTVSPLLGLWTKFRDIVYLLLVIVFIITGLAIMLRVKIDPRTVMTIESQIPKIIISVLLVTFSFSFVGFFIDMMWTFTYVAVNVLASTENPPIDTQPIINNMYTPPVGFFNEVMKSNCDGKANLGGTLCVALDAGQSVQRIVYSLFTNNQAVSLYVPALSAGDAANCDNETGEAKWYCEQVIKARDANTNIQNIGGAIGTMTTNIIGSLASWVIGGLGILVVTVAILVTMLRLWIELLKAYIYILLHTVLAPFWMIGGLVPGSPVSFNGWLREIISSLSVFPVTISMFLLGKVFMDSFASANQTVYLPLIGNPGDARAFGSIIGLGIIFITPEVVTMMKDLLKAPPFKYSRAIGPALSTGQKLGLAAPSKLWETLWRPPDHVRGTGPGILRYATLVGIEHLPGTGKRATQVRAQLVRAAHNIWGDPHHKP